jgi:hypothetical protein
MMYCHTAAERRIVFDTHVSAEHDRIGHDDTIFDDTIVGNVGIGHEVAVMSDSRCAFVFLCASVHGNAFAEDVAIPDDYLGRRTLIGEILRFTADHTARKESIVATDGCVTRQRHAILETRAASDLYIGAYDAMVADTNIFV